MEVPEWSSKTMRRPVRAVSARESAHADHASQERLRPPILPTSRCPILAPCVTTSLYRKITRRVSHKPLRGPFSEPRTEPQMIYLLRMQAYIACILETGRGFFEASTRSRAGLPRVR